MRSQNRPSRSGLSVAYVIGSGFGTSPEDQSRICLLDASPIRIASKSLMSIKFSPQSLLVFELEVNEVCVTHGADLRVRFLYGLRAFGDLDVVEIAERLVGRQCQFT